jgi:ABC-type transport system substrate-binding protein
MALAMDMLIDTGDISMKMAQKYQEDWKQVGITVNLIPIPWSEKILMEDMVVAPDYYRVAHWTYKTYLTGVVNRGIGANTDFYWADIDMTAKMADKK